MSEKVVINPELLKSLSDLKGYTLLRDSAGKTLGVYLPVQERNEGEKTDSESPKSPT